MAEAPTVPTDEGRPAGTEDEGFALSDVPGTADRPADERGTLDVRTRAVAKIARHAAGEVAGTVRSGSALSRTSGGALGTSYPGASARIDAGRASIELDMAVLWPAPVAEVAREARDHVLERTRELSGIDIRTVDVTVHVVASGAAGSGGSDDDRRVQ